jgi:hypothetical protein
MSPILTQRHRPLAVSMRQRLDALPDKALLAEQARIVQLLVERVDVQEDALEVRIRTDGLASLVGELRQQGERMAA